MCIRDRQRSLDGSSFTTIGNINGKGNSNQETAYQFLDGNAPEGLSYYQIVQVDYDGKFSNTNMTLRQAIWQSTNSIAVKVGLKVGVNAIYDEARRFGITGRVARVPAMVLGSADVRPIEMISAYTTFANLGDRVTPIAILRVEDKRGKILYQEKTKRTTVLDEGTAFTLATALRGVVTNGTANASVYRAGFTIPSGGKTGTTNDYRDVWYIGFTKDLVAGVWMGFDSPQWIMPGAQGGKLAAPAWTQRVSNRQRSTTRSRSTSCLSLIHISEPTRPY